MGEPWEAEAGWVEPWEAEAVWVEPWEAVCNHSVSHPVAKHTYTHTHTNPQHLYLHIHTPKYYNTYTIYRNLQNVQKRIHPRPNHYYVRTFFFLTSIIVVPKKL